MEVIEVIDTQIEVIQVTEREVEIVEVIESGPRGVQGEGLQVLTTQGDTVYRGPSEVQRLPIGTAGQILKVSSGGIPEWGAAPSSGVTSVSGTSPIVSSGGATPAISITEATTSVAGSMSAADKLKLDGIASGAEVNVNSDWNASSGDAQILNKPTIPSASSSIPSALGTASAGSSANFSRADHIHAMPTAADVGAAATSHTHVLADITDAGTAAAVDADQNLNTTDTPEFAQLGLGEPASATASCKLTILGESDVEPAAIIKGAQWFGSINGNQGVLYQGDVEDKVKIIALNSEFTEYKTLELVSDGDAFTFPATGGELVISDDARIVNIEGNSIDTRSLGTGIGGNIKTYGDDANGGEIDTHGEGNAGGEIYTYGSGDGQGGAILTHAGVNGSGGSINTSDGGGHIDTSAGGGSISTTGTGSIELGYFGTRTTLTGAATADRAISLPDEGGTLVVDAASDGKQYARKDGAWVEVTAGGEVRFDSSGNYTYTGQADAGSAESASVWYIRRSEFSSGSYVGTLTANNVKWDDRLTASYT